MPYYFRLKIINCVSILGKIGCRWHRTGQGPAPEDNRDCGRHGQSADRRPGDLVNARPAGRGPGRTQVGGQQFRIGLQRWTPKCGRVRS